ncbi:MAG: cardiolipin synthase [Proteobacteria bacterium]|nr:cardiolipin synthase [Pseudomonadota bacterium]
MFSSLYYSFGIVLAIAAIIHLLVHKREPVSTISWGLFVILVPLLGPALYFTFGPERLIRQASKRKLAISSHSAPIAHGLKNTTAEYSSKDKTDLFFNLTQNITHFPQSVGNKVLFLHDPQEALRTMISEIERAQKFIHLEYYIISSDPITENIFDSLIAARARGVEIRILYDALGSLSLKRFHFKRLKAAGIQIAGFLPFSLLPQRINMNFRNHRKILVIDGRTVFTGGTNLGKEYLGRPGKHQWRDFSIQLWGPVCLQLQDVFREDWSFTTQEDLTDPKYFPIPVVEGNAKIQVIDSGPDTSFQSLHRALFGAITSAKYQILLMTPYFVPDSSILTALEVASLKGVDLKIVLPKKNDQPLVRLASRSFYGELLKAGVKIFEFAPKILHAKLMTIDNEFTLIGSGNMDIRSFRLNFEITLLIEDRDVTQQAQQFFNTDLRSSEPVTWEQFSGRGFLVELLENACRLLAPIL